MPCVTFSIRCFLFINFGVYFDFDYAKHTVPVMMQNKLVTIIISILKFFFSFVDDVIPRLTIPTEVSSTASHVPILKRFQFVLFTKNIFFQE